METSNKLELTVELDYTPVPASHDDLILQTIKSPRDMRPTLDGWSPGTQLNKCRDCKKFFLGDASSFTCSNCAYGTFKLCNPEEETKVYQCIYCGRFHTDSTSTLNYHYSDCKEYYRKNRRS
jgi:hypothetical protein